MPSATADTPTRAGSAPSYSVPQERVSLGGEHQLKDVIEHRLRQNRDKVQGYVTPLAGVSLRPNDPFAKKLPSTGVETQNVLIRVTVPKRTGRKRKRGSDEPFSGLDDAQKHSGAVTSQDLLGRLRDNTDNYTVQAIGVIEDTHAFKDLPDFQLRADEVPIMRELRDHAMTPNYETLKNFHVDLKPGFEGITTFPGPPSFAPSGQPYRYEYQQMKQANNETTKAKNPPKTSLRKIGVSLDMEDAPIGPPPGLPEPQGKALLETIDKLEQLLKDRPIITKRVAYCLQDLRSDKYVKEAIPYVGYYVGAGGAWSNCIVKYGVDPRSDPKYRFHQTVSYQVKDVRKRLDTGEYANAPEKDKGHIFDGHRLEHGQLWQLCDLTDPVLQHILNNAELRSEPDMKQWGWYYNGTVTKVRVIMRDKMHRLMEEKPPLPESDYLLLAGMPDRIDDSTKNEISKADHGVHLRQMASSIKNEARFDWGYSTNYRIARPEVGKGQNAERAYQVDGVDEEAEDGRFQAEHVDDGSPQAENERFGGEGSGSATGDETREKLEQCNSEASIGLTRASPVSA